MTVAEALVRAVRHLRAAGIGDAAPGDARALLAHALDVAPDRLIVMAPVPMPGDAAARLDALITRRAARAPVSHLTGTRLFWGRSFRVTPDVLDPRPETETLIAAAMAEPFARLLDLGTGSGAIAITLLAEGTGATGVGVDLSQAALAVAKVNAAAHGVAGRLALRQGDWFAGVVGRFDLIVSNPPYVALAEMPDLAPEVLQEPHIALTDGADGLSAYRAITASAGAHLAAQGRLMVEIGPTQAQAVADMMVGAGLCDIRILQDLDLRPRVVAARAR